MVFRSVLIFIVFVLTFAPHLSAQSLKIGVVDLNQALNQSEKGLRFKNLLEGKSRRIQQELKLEEGELRKTFQDLTNNVLLTPESKRQKEIELQQKQQALQQKARKYETELRKEERTFTQSIFKELKTAIRAVSLQGKYDLVIERNVTEQLILFMNEDVIDLTQKVVDYYNSLNTKK